MAALELRHRADDGASIFLRRWTPDSAPMRGIVHIAHGMAEHSARYARLAARLNRDGWLVQANDHRGHGFTAPMPADLGHVADRDGWRRLIDDQLELLAAARAEHPAKLVLFGHSMGSFMAQQILGEQPSLVDAAILSGSDGKPLGTARIGRLVVKIERLRLGPRGKSRLIGKMTFGAFNKRFAPNRTDFDWLSRDGREVDAYVTDPFCGFDCSAQFWTDLLAALQEIAKPALRHAIPEEPPILILSGDRDPVGANLAELIAGYRAAGLKRLTVKFYPDGRHEMLNETNRDQVMDDIAAWLESEVPRN